MYINRANPSSCHVKYAERVRDAVQPAHRADALCLLTGSPLTFFGTSELQACAPFRRILKESAPFQRSFSLPFILREFELLFGKCFPISHAVFMLSCYGATSCSKRDCRFLSAVISLHLRSVSLPASAPRFTRKNA